MADSEIEESMPLQLSETQTQPQGGENVQTEPTQEMAPSVENIVEPEVFRTVDGEPLAADYEVFKSKVEVGSLVFARVGSLYQSGEVVEREDDKYKVRFSDGTTTLAEVTGIFPDLALTKGISLMHSSTGEKGALLGYRKIEEEVLPTKQFNATLKVTEESKEVLRSVPRSQLAIEESVVAGLFPSSNNDSGPSNESSLFLSSGEMSLPEMQSTPLEEPDAGGDVKSQHSGSDNHSLSNGTPEEGDDTKAGSGDIVTNIRTVKSVTATTETKDESSPGEGFSPFGKQKEHDSSDSKTTENDSISVAESETFRAPYPKRNHMICHGTLLKSVEYKFYVSVESTQVFLEKLKALGDLPGCTLNESERKSIRSSSSSSDPRASRASAGYEGDLDATLSTQASGSSEEHKSGRPSVFIEGEAIAPPTRVEESASDVAFASPTGGMIAESTDSPGIVVLPTPEKREQPQEVDLVSPEGDVQAPEPEDKRTEHLQSEPQVQTPATKTPRRPAPKSSRKKKKVLTSRTKAPAMRVSVESTTETDGPTEPKRKPRKKAQEPQEAPPNPSLSSSDDSGGSAPPAEMENDLRAGKKVYARWMAKGIPSGYYPGVLGERQSTGLWKVRFEDGATKNLADDEIFPQFALRLTPVISYKVSEEDEEFKRGTVLNCETHPTDIQIKPDASDDSSAAEEADGEGAQPIWVDRKLTFFDGNQSVFLFRALKWDKKPAAGTLPPAIVGLDQVVSSRTRPSNKYGTPVKDETASRSSSSKLSAGKRGRVALVSASEGSDSSAVTPSKRHRGSPAFSVKKGKGLRTLLKGHAFVLSFAEEPAFYRPAPLSYIEEEGGEDFVVTSSEGVEYNKEHLVEQLEYMGALVRSSVDDLAILMKDGISHCYLISNRVSSTKEYLKAAAMGIPIFSHKWLLDIIAEGIMKPAGPYKLRHGVLDEVGTKSFESKKLFDIKVGVISKKENEEDMKDVTQFWRDVIGRGAMDPNVVTFHMNDLDNMSVEFVIVDEVDDEQLTELQKKFHIPFVDPEWMLTQLKDKSFKDSLIDEMVSKAKND